MENSNVKKSVLSSVLLGGAFLAAAAVGIYQYQNVKESEKEIVELNDRAENLMNQQDKLSEEVNDLTSELQRKIAEAEASAKELEDLKLENKKGSIYSFKANQRRKDLEADLTKKNNEIGNLQSQLASLGDMKIQLEKELEIVPELEAANEDLKNQVSDWEKKYAILEKDFMDLNSRYQKLIYDAPADNFIVEVLTSRGKLTSKAKKAHSISVSFLMPAYLQREKGGMETLYLSLFDEKIKPISGWIKEVNVNTEKGSIPVQVHAVKDVDYSKNPQVVNFTVLTQENIEEGSYKGKVYSKNDYLGTVDFRLR